MQTSQKRARSKSPSPGEVLDDPTKRTRHIDTTRLRGEVLYVSSYNSDPSRRRVIVDHVKWEISQPSTPEHLRLFFFCDASINPKVLPSLPGGYAVVFDEHSPAHADHGKKVIMAWHMPHMIDNMIGEATAVAQAIQVAGEKLRAAHLASPQIKAATVQVFTDGNQVLQHIDGASSVKGFRQETYRKVIRLVYEQSHELGYIPGLDVTLQLLWVPGHEGEENNDLADKAAKQISRNPRQSNFFTVDSKRRVIASMPAAVFLPLQYELEAETRRTKFDPSSSWQIRGIRGRKPHRSFHPSSGLSNDVAARPTYPSTPPPPVEPRSDLHLVQPRSHTNGSTFLVDSAPPSEMVPPATSTVEKAAAADEFIAAVEHTAVLTVDAMASAGEEVTATGNQVDTPEVAGGGTNHQDGTVDDDVLMQLAVDIQLFGEMEEAIWRELREDVNMGILKQLRSVIEGRVRNS